MIDMESYVIIDLALRIVGSLGSKIQSPLCREIRCDDRSSSMFAMGSSGVLSPRAFFSWDPEGFYTLP